MMTDPNPARLPNSNTEFTRGFRQAFDPVLSLLIAVLLVRTFLVEGYLISTGSMAPHYYGEQKRVVCPQCQFQFAVGTEFDEDSLIETDDFAACPNCMANESDLSNQPINRGDHLLVWKNAYQFRNPRRGEVIVFRNPNEPRETYIKRVVGLPEEEVLIRDGNLWVDGKIVQKSLEEQRAQRVLVFDSAYQPPDSETWAGRWSSDTLISGWTPTDSGWKYRPEYEDDWLTYRHTLRFGGVHESTVCLPESMHEQVATAFIPRKTPFPFAPEPPFPGVRLEENCLIATGVLSAVTHQKLRKVIPTDDYQSAVDQLLVKSHRTHVTDFTAYNHDMPTNRLSPIHEFSLETNIVPSESSGVIFIELNTPTGFLRCEIDLKAQRVGLYRPQEEEPLMEEHFRLDAHGFLFEISSFDDRLLVAINKSIVMEPWPLNSASDSPHTPFEITRISGSAEFELKTLKLYRDIYYTSQNGEYASEQAFQVPADHYFVLGDNSRVSSDSRRWEQPTVPRKLLIGKPFLVHLPSTQETIGWRTWQIPYRKPDFSRIRFVR
ncbi:MAG: signal peptidase I [Planctomycetaceae bacterium]|jgi:signal peptidase I|nr:signal peptidase I [Planctomycetaceae bacterium]